MNNDQKIDCILEKVSSMDEKINDLQSDVKSIKLQIENEICPNIMRVAEGHMDLDRKLKEVVTSRTEYEMLTLRVNHLEAAVEKIEKKIS
ncbi:MAG: hypothetical protein E7301_03410 [Butyrivibrio sp.]|nr:hypothetical protein [Butyrivibrio sp.]